MTTRASRVFPGVLASMLLAGSFLATPTPASADTQPRKALTHEQRRGSGTARAQKSAKSSANKSQATKSAAARRRHTSPAAASTVAFIDDGFSYTEDPDGRVGWKQTGVASWYGGPRWQGHHTSSGARYEQDALTAAHATLPLGTQVRVTLANSDRSVIVTITDRPGTRTRIIDLSRGAARALGILSQGVAVVTLSPS
jgi:rare lipoprotein A (peptidoglycan hydrolase)